MNQILKVDMKNVYTKCAFNVPHINAKPLGWNRYLHTCTTKPLYNILHFNINIQHSSSHTNKCMIISLLSLLIPEISMYCMEKISSFKSGTQIVELYM